MQSTLPRHRVFRRHLSPSAELRVGEQMRMRMGMIVAMLLMLSAMAAVAQVVR